MALGWVSRVNANPPMIGVGVHKSHYTPRGYKGKWELQRQFSRRGDG